MFKISRLTDYSLRIVVRLSAERAIFKSSSELAVQCGISDATVRKVLKRLNDSDFITSLQGASGGYQLTRSLHAISLLDLITAMEGDVAITNCSLLDGCCDDDGRCGFKMPWRDVNRKIYDVLSGVSLASMVQPVNNKALQYYAREDVIRSGA